jgi:branched-chain amino acid transport system permease protein
MSLSAWRRAVGPAARLRETAAGRAVARVPHQAWFLFCGLAIAVSPAFDTRVLYLIITIALFVVFRLGMTRFAAAVVFLAFFWLVFPERLLRVWTGIDFDLPLRLTAAEEDIFFLVGLYVLLGIGLNVVVGFAGLLDLGYVAFFAIGAYAWGMVSSPVSPVQPDIAISWWLIAPLAMVIAAAAGALLGLPVLRLRGDYLAIVTLGFGEIIRIIILNATDLTNGTQGLYRIGRIAVPDTELRNAGEVFLLVLIGAFAMAFAALRLQRSRVGRAWEAIREDEDVAAAMGVDTTRFKLLAFAIGASLGGLGGAIFAARQGAIFPQDFTLIVSINVVALVIIGGMGSIPGVVLGALVLIGLPEVLRDVRLGGLIDPARDRLILYGALLVAVMVLRPAGILPARRRELEFAQAESAAEEQKVD